MEGSSTTVIKNQLAKLPLLWIQLHMAGTQERNIIGKKTLEENKYCNTYFYVFNAL